MRHNADQKGTHLWPSFSGTKLGPHEITSLLGTGGMGEVYRARDIRLERTVAIKILPTHLSSNSDSKARFEREARAISSLNHPYICHLYDIGSQDGTAYLVMEYLEGETLAQRLRKGAIPLRQALQYGVQIADALATAHRAGILHRDLKPGNIMLTPVGRQADGLRPGKGSSGVRCHKHSRRRTNTLVAYPVIVRAQFSSEATDPTWLSSGNVPVHGARGAARGECRCTQRYFQPGLRALRNGDRPTGI